jgi:hypothetical protein
VSERVRSRRGGGVREGRERTTCGAEPLAAYASAMFGWRCAHRVSGSSHASLEQVRSFRGTAFVSVLLR